MTCNNCEADALYGYRMTEKSVAWYCAAHLPRFLHARRDAGLLETSDKFRELAASAIAALAVSTPQIDLEPTVEEPAETPAEELPVAKPRARKKAAAKKSTSEDLAEIDEDNS